MGVVTNISEVSGHISGFVNQRTLKSAITCSGVGLHSGQRITITLRPAPADHGIVFRRVDKILNGEPVSIPADWRHVVNTMLCTVLGNGDDLTIGTVEHLLSALAGCEVDNVVIDIDGPEVPIMDGSAAPFVFLIECAGTVAQQKPRQMLKIKKPVTLEDKGKKVSLSPLEDSDSQTLAIDFEIQFDNAVIARQKTSYHVGRASYKNDIARARTFGFLHEVEQMHAAGLARGGSLENAVVLDGDTVMNEEGLRYADEFVRHKVLDSVGDLYLAGAPILGRYQGVKAGHALNNAILKALFESPESFCWQALPESQRGSAGGVPNLMRAVAAAF